MNTEVVYGIFRRFVSNDEGDELPDKFEDLPERDRQNIESLYREFIPALVDNEFKDSLLDDGRLDDAARILVLAFKTKHDNAIESLRMCIGAFVLSASDHPCVEQGRKMAEEIIKTLEG